MPARSMPLALRAGACAARGWAGVAASTQVLVSAAAVRIQRNCRMGGLLWWEKTATLVPRPAGRGMTFGLEASICRSAPSARPPRVGVTAPLAYRALGALLQKNWRASSLVAIVEARAIEVGGVLRLEVPVLAEV